MPRTFLAVQPETGPPCDACAGLLVSAPCNVFSPRPRLARVHHHIITSRIKCTSWHPFAASLLASRFMPGTCILELTLIPASCSGSLPLPLLLGAYTCLVLGRMLVLSPGDGGVGQDSRAASACQEVRRQNHKQCLGDIPSMQVCMPPLT